MNRLPPHAPDRLLAFLKPRKDRNRKNPDVLNAVRFLFLMALVAQSLRVAFSSPRLRLTEVRVTGSHRLAPAEVIRMGAVPLGENLFRVNLVRVSQRLLRDPVYREVVVTRDLPHALHVDFQERVPALQLAAGGALRHADREGVVFQPAPLLSPKMPLLELPPAELPPPGQRLRPELVRAVWECERLGRREGVAVRKMRVDEAGELWLNIATYPTSQASAGTLAVRVGRPTDLPEKFRDIRQALLGWPNLAVSAAYLNVMCAGRPAYRRLWERTASR